MPLDDADEENAQAEGDDEEQIDENDNENEEDVQESTENEAEDDEDATIDEEPEVENEEVIDEYIETAICLHGRTEGQHQEMGDEMVNYCFTGYDSVSGRPVYKGQFGEIRWTQSAGSYGGSYGLFLYNSNEDWPIAYCFSEETKDISVCDRL